MNIKVQSVGQLCIRNMNVHSLERARTHQSVSVVRVIWIIKFQWQAKWISRHYVEWSNGHVAITLDQQIKGTLNHQAKIPVHNVVILPIGMCHLYRWRSQTMALRIRIDFVLSLISCCHSLCKNSSSFGTRFNR